MHHFSMTEKVCVVDVNTIDSTELVVRTIGEWGYDDLKALFISEEIDIRTFTNENFINCIPRLVKPIRREIDFTEKWRQFVQNVRISEPVSPTSTVRLLNNRAEPVASSSAFSPAVTQLPKENLSVQSTVTRALCDKSDSVDLNALLISDKRSLPDLEINTSSSSDSSLASLPQVGVKRKGSDELKQQQVPPKHQRVEKSANSIADKIRTILSSSLRGKSCLKCEGKELPAKLQNVVAELIIDNLLAVNKESDRIPHSLIAEYARGIVEIFPSEVLDVYYIPYVYDKTAGIKIPARGKLIQYYHNIPRELKKAGLSISNATEENNNDPVDGDDTLLKYLECRVGPWDDIKNAWKKTSQYRLHQLQAAGEELPVRDYFEKYKALRQPDGHILVEIDFETLFPDKKLALFDAWPAFREKAVIALADKAPSPQSELHEALNVVNSQEFSEDSKNAAVLLNLSHLCDVITARRVSSINRRGGKKEASTNWRPNRHEIQEGFVTLLPSASKLQEFYEERVKKADLHGFKVGPSVVLTGSIENIRNSYVVVDKTYWCFESPLAALDVCFKAYQSLHAAYNVESYRLWRLVQHKLYDVSTKWDIKCSNLPKLLKLF